jgi:hypothetical protein
MLAASNVADSRSREFRLLIMYFASHFLQAAIWWLLTLHRLDQDTSYKEVSARKLRFLFL